MRYRTQTHIDLKLFHNTPGMICINGVSHQLKVNKTVINTCMNACKEHRKHGEQGGREEQKRAKWKHKKRALSVHNSKQNSQTKRNEPHIFAHTQTHTGERARTRARARAHAHAHAHPYIYTVATVFAERRNFLLFRSFAPASLPHSSTYDSSVLFFLLKRWNSKKYQMKIIFHWLHFNRVVEVAIVCLYEFLWQPRKHYNVCSWNKRRKKQNFPFEKMWLWFHCGGKFCNSNSISIAFVRKVAPNGDIENSTHRRQNRIDRFFVVQFFETEQCMHNWIRVMSTNPTTNSECGN